VSGSEQASNQLLSTLLPSNPNLKNNQHSEDLAVMLLKETETKRNRKSSFCFHPSPNKTKRLSTIKRKANEGQLWEIYTLNKTQELSLDLENFRAPRRRVTKK
jgi:hypothetical protein